jgi:hypothetical protein
MRKTTLYILFALTALINSEVHAQNKLKREVSGFAMPMIGGRILTTDGVPENYTGTEAEFNDSLSSADMLKISLGGGVGISYYKDEFSRLELGIRYSDQGFTRVKKGLAFGDLIHPEIGVVKDLSSTGNSKDVHFVYRYQYLQFPIMYHFAPYKVKKYAELDFFFTTGISVNVLFQHTVRAKLQGWTAFGDEVFDIERHEYDPSIANANIHFGFRLHYQMDGKTSLLFNPTASMGILQANDGIDRHRLFDISIPIGFVYTLENK